MPPGTFTDYVISPCSSEVEKSSFTQNNPEKLKDVSVLPSYGKRKFILFGQYQQQVHLPPANTKDSVVCQTYTVLLFQGHGPFFKRYVLEVV